MTILYCFHVYPVLEGFELLLLCFWPDWCLLECVLLDGFLLGCFEYGSGLELPPGLELPAGLEPELGGFGGLGPLPQLGGHSSRGSLIGVDFLTPGNSLTLGIRLDRLRPLV